MSRNVKVGIALIVLGAVFLLDNLHIIRIDSWWPIILILGGVGFFLVWYSDRQQTGLLLPAAILFVLGCQFLFLFADWPIYVLAPALGFWLMYFLGQRDTGLLIPAFILTVVALVGWFEGSVMEVLWPILFIILGILLVFMGRSGKRNTGENVVESETDNEGASREGDVVS